MFIGCKGTGIKNTSATLCAYNAGGTLKTTVTNVNDYFKVNTNVTVKDASKFTVSGNKFTSISAINTRFKVSGHITFTGGNNHVIYFRVGKNNDVTNSTQSAATANVSGRAENVPFSDIFDMNQGDYVELFLRDITGTGDVTVTDFVVVIEALN